MKILKVTVTDKNTVYVNDTRITGRGSKWGIHYTVDEFRCAAKNVRNRLIQRGYGNIRLDALDAAEFGI
jgi:predicted GH43/DUF377 family glycosyl hydrolase